MADVASQTKDIYRPFSHLNQNRGRGSEESSDGYQLATVCSISPSRPSMGVTNGDEFIS